MNDERLRDEREAAIWWKVLTEAERVQALREARTTQVAVAWAHWKRWGGYYLPPE